MYEGVLKIGDVIHIKNLAMDSILFAEGILQEDVAVNSALSSFEDALFCIHLQRQYSAALELEKCIELHPDASCSEDVTVSKYYDALQVCNELLFLDSSSRYDITSAVYSAAERMSTS